MSRSVQHPLRPLARVAHSILLLILASAPAAAWATHGGPSTLEVLGRDADNTVYLLRKSEGGYDGPPEVLFLQLGQPGARLQAAPSYAPGQDPTDERLATIRTQIKALKSRLVALPKAPKADWSVVTKTRGKEFCPDTPWDDARLCDVLDVQFKAAGQQADHRFYAWPGHRAVQSAWRLADGGVLFIYRSTGMTTETGYAYDDAVLVRPSPTPATALPWTQGCSTTSCTVNVGSRSVIKQGPGLIKCVAQDGWLGCVHAPDEGANTEGWFVRLADGETIKFGADWVLETTGIGPDGLGVPKRDLTAPRWDTNFLVWGGRRFRRPPGK